MPQRSREASLKLDFVVIGGGEFELPDQEAPLRSVFLCLLIKKQWILLLIHDSLNIPFER